MTTASEFLSKDHVFLDTETTGASLSDEVVEICIANADGDIIIDTLIRPTIEILDGATAIHGISNDMVCSAPSWPEVWPEIEKALVFRWVGIYNAEFDLRLIMQTHVQHEMVWVPTGGVAFCIMKLYAKFHGEWDSYHRSYTWQSLENAGRQCGIDIPNTHRAKDDTLLAREVLLHIAKAVANGVD